MHRKPFNWFGRNIFRQLGALESVMNGMQLKEKAFCFAVEILVM